MPSPESLSIGATHYLPDGARISVRAVESKPMYSAIRKPASDTAVHEAGHAVVAIENGTGVSRVTVIPGPGYGGLTELSRVDPIAAAAPHANGRSGTGHDISIVRYMGHDVASMSAIARGITDKKREHISAVASLLDEKGTIGGSDVQNAMSEVDHSKSEVKKPSVMLFIKKPDGTEDKETLDSVSGSTVLIPNEWVTISKTPKPNHEKILSRQENFVKL